MSSDIPADSETADVDLGALLGACPLPLTDYKEVVLAHGSGGKLGHQLIEKLVLPQFRNQFLEPLHDGAIFAVGETRVAFTTDSYVVSPIFFPGGDIGKLAVHGTVNDLAMCGARPLHLSAGFILEEGLAMEDFWRVVQSMREAADASGVKLVTGDTKVVDHGKADKMFISTTHGVWAANLDGTYTLTFAGFAFDNGGNFLATQRIRVAVEVNETQDGFSGPFNTDFIGADGQVLASSNGTVRGTRILAESPA